MREIAQQMRSEMQRRITNIEVTAERLPEGSLSTQESNRGTRLYWDHHETTFGLRQRKQTRLHDEDYPIAKGIQKRLIQNLELKALKTNIYWLDQFLNNYQPDREAELILKLKEPYRSLPGIDGRLFEEHKPIQSENPAFPDDLVHENIVGEFFRSKSEMHISELLLQMKIPYRYEKKLICDNEYKYPDFTLKKADSTYVYIEYFGMLDHEGYGERMIKTTNWYLSHKFIPGRDILFLFENSKSGMNLPAVSKQIRDFVAC